MRHSHPIEPRAAIGELVGSRIRAVANAGLGQPDVLPFWFGEPDAVTPQFVRDAAVAALADGATFYTSNLGITPLREGLARYVGALHGASLDPERIAVTSSGMSALMIAMQALIGPGDRVVVVTPVWPNLTEGPRILGADVVRVALDCVAGVWRLDVERLLAALTADTRVLLLNSPNNPTGWVIDASRQRAILEHCRQLGIWIVADDVYERIHFGQGAVAPSFLDMADAQDRVISSNSFSKAWQMTGWRLGWLVSPRGADGATLIEHFGKLIEYNTCCAPEFVQRAGLIAIEQGEVVIEATLARYRAARDHLCERLSRLPGITAAAPAGAMYIFFRVDGVSDSLELCKALVREAGLGLAPGAAFGGEAEGYVRWCFASSHERLDEGIARLTGFLERRRTKAA